MRDSEDKKDQEDRILPLEWKSRPEVRTLQGFFRQKQSLLKTIGVSTMVQLSKRRGKRPSPESTYQQVGAGPGRQAALLLMENELQMMLSYIVSIQLKFSTPHHPPYGCFWNYARAGSEVCSSPSRNGWCPKCFLLRTKWRRGEVMWSAPGAREKENVQRTYF